MNRKAEQGELLFKLGTFLGPVLKMMESPNLYDSDERTRIIARLYGDRDRLVSSANWFFSGEAGHDYMLQRDAFYNALSGIQNAIRELDSDSSLAHGLLENTANALRSAVLAVPIPIDSTIYEARTPFSTYCFVKDLCTTARTRITWLDRYFDQTIFHRFFADTAATVQITLVTLPDTRLRGPADQRRHAEFMDISRLFAAERGPAGYRLVSNADFHDRWLRVDDRLFTLGGSIKDLAKPFTISKLDSTPANQKHFDDVIAAGSEVFGPNQPTHP